MKEKKNDQIINNLFNKSKISIVNADDEDLELLQQDNSIFITYGFNSKATVTVSSYNINDYMELNVCLQRELIPFTGAKLEPFECKLRAFTNKVNHIHSLLAATSLSLLIGNSILTRDLNNTLLKN